jgi:tetratricopeptide (TPR) repeat protein
MRYLTKFFMILLPLLFMISCGGDPLEEGNKAFNEGKYNEAIIKYREALKEKPNDVMIKEKLALANMHKGLDLYKRRKNIKAFQGNYDKAMSNLDGDISTPELKKDYSAILYELAKAYSTTKPENDIQKKLYLNKTLEFLEQAVEVDAGNKEAKDMLAQVQADNFQEMFDKGVSYYNSAKKNKNDEDYLLAEYYLAKAVSFKSDDEEAAKYLKLARKKAISVFDFDTDFPIAIAGYQQKGKFTFFDFTIANNTTETITVKPESFFLADKDGNQYTYDAEQTDKFEGGLTKSAELKTGKHLDIVLSFPAAKGIALDYLAYKGDNGNIVKKYLP